MVRIITYDTAAYADLFEFMIEKAPNKMCFCISNKFLVHYLTEKSMSKYLIDNSI